MSEWIRFPIKIADRKLFDSLNGEVPEEEWQESWIDIRRDSIVTIRQFIQDSGKVEGTLIYTTSGNDFATTLMPSVVKKILNYEPFKP